MNTNSLVVEKKFTVVLDICSSSVILEDLFKRGKLKFLIFLLTRLKSYLKRRKDDIGFEIYKFTGDGWIIFFPRGTSARELFDFLNDLSMLFQKTYDDIVRPQLSRRIKDIGLTFGVAFGKLFRMKMLGKREYIGRSLVVATRLQGQTGDNPHYKVLLTRTAAKELQLKRDEFSFFLVPRSLRNISRDNELWYVVLKLPILETMRAS